MGRLILSRHRFEELVITVGATRVVVSVCDIRGDKCRIGVEAPPEVTIHRREIQDAIDRHKPGSTQ